ncbi:MAG: hypothetical protein R3B84_03370 [Zavarzinella sp.]
MNDALQVELLELNQVVARLQIHLRFDYQAGDTVKGFICGPYAEKSQMIELTYPLIFPEVSGSPVVGRCTITEPVLATPTRAVNYLLKVEQYRSGELHEIWQKMLRFTLPAS